jgi:hypothetical protein
MTIDQGSDFSQSFNFNAFGYPAPMNAYSLQGQMRPNYASEDYVDFTVTESANNFIVSLTNSQTKNLVSGNYVYDLELTRQLSIIDGYYDNDLNKVVLYTGAERYFIGIIVLRASVGIVTIPGNKVDIFDLNGDGIFTSSEAFYWATAYLSPHLYEDYVATQQQYQIDGIYDNTLENKLLNRNVRALTSTDILINRALQGNVTVTREVSR